MNNEFLTRLIRAENELRDLKTAHERGLGVVDFYSRTASMTVAGPYSKDITVTATAAPDEPTPPFVQLTPRIPTGTALSFISADVSSDGRSLVSSYRLMIGEGSGYTVTFTAISASRLQALTIQEAS